MKYTILNKIKTAVNRSKMAYNAFKEYYEWQNAINQEKALQKAIIDRQWRKYELKAAFKFRKDLSAIK